MRKTSGLLFTLLFMIIIGVGALCDSQYSIFLKLFNDTASTLLFYVVVIRVHENKIIVRILVFPPYVSCT